MAKTYIQLQKEIDQLQLEAAKLMAREKSDVIEKVKDAIKTYELTPRELFGAKAGAKTGTATAGGKTKAKLSATPKFSDGAGNFWVGRGKRPDWLRDALASGRDLADFAIGVRRVVPPKAEAGMSTPKAVKPMNASKPKKAATNGATTLGARYKDADGNSWSGRGPMPKWLKAAVAGGKSLEQLAA